MKVIIKEFDCSYNYHLHSLKGSPEVCETFNCSHTDIPNFIGGPKIIYLDFKANVLNELISLEGFPKRIDNCLYMKHSLPYGLNVKDIKDVCQIYSHRIFT